MTDTRPPVKPVEGQNKAVDAAFRVMFEAGFCPPHSCDEVRFWYKLQDAIEAHEKASGEIERMRAEVAALQAFKDYVHERLDQAGIPTHPDGEHSKAGCRIGDRLDIALAAQALKGPAP